MKTVSIPKLYEKINMGIFRLISEMKGYYMTDEKIPRTLKYLYIISAVLMSPLLYFIPVIGNSLWMFQISLRCLYIQYIVFAILTVIYIITLKKIKPNGAEYLIFIGTLIFHIVDFICLEFLFTAAMGI